MGMPQLLKWTFVVVNWSRPLGSIEAQVLIFIKIRVELAEIYGNKEIWECLTIKVSIKGRQRYRKM